MQLVALDTETDLIVPGRLAPRLTCVTTAVNGQDDPQLWHVSDNGLIGYLESLLRDSRIVFIGHNIAYDFAVIAAEFPVLLPAIFDAYEAGRVLDTMLREKLIDIASVGRTSNTRGYYSLAGLVQRRFGVTLDKDTHRTGYGPLRYVPLADWPAGAAKYAMDDAAWTLKVCEAQHTQADDYHDPDPTKAYALVNELAQTRAAFALQLVSCWGVRTNRAKIDAFEAPLHTELAKLKAKLLKIGILQPKRPTRKQAAAGIDPGTRKVRKEVEDRVQDAYDGDAPLTATGAVSIARKTLRDANDEELALVARYGEIEKLISTYIPLLRRGQDVPINTRYNTLLNSGRVSASPNTQNFPRMHGPRECFEPRPGMVYCSVDYDTAELRALAAYCEDEFGESRMADALRSGDDLHLMLAATILGISYDEAKRKKKDPEVYAARQLAKILNFGLGGGMGVRRLVEACAIAGVQIDETRARELIAAYKQQWPEIAQAFTHAARATEATGVADALTPWSGRLRANCYYSEFLNNVFQASVADMAKAALFAVVYECYTDRLYPGTPAVAGTPLYGSRVVMFLHDELFAELPAEQADAAARRMAQLQTAVAGRTQERVLMTCTPALMLEWSKGAEAVYNAEGELVPWVAG